MPDLHEPGAVEAVSLDHHDEEVEAGEKGSEDYKGAEDGREAYVEKAMEDGAEIYLGGDTTRQRMQEQRRYTSTMACTQCNHSIVGPMVENHLNH